MSTTTPVAESVRPPRPERLSASTRAQRRVRPEHLGLLAILVLSGLLEFARLSQNGFANLYYSAGVKSMLGSWHNFFYLSADPNALISLDKPPLGLWLQAVSAKLFGFAPLPLIVPEGICAVLAVALLYRIVAPRFGAVAGLIAAFSLAVFPAFVAVSRENAIDPLLILFMLAACGAALAAIDSGRLRSLLWCAVLVGLAFNTKALAALLCVPGIALGYALYAPVPLRQRLARLMAAGVVFALVAVSWMTIVELTPASQRPFIGDTAGNSEFELAFGYNGFGRVGGEYGGPGPTKLYLTPAQTRPLVRPGVNSPPTAAERRILAAHRPSRAHAKHTRSPAPHGRQRRRNAIPFGGTRSPVRIFGIGLGGQAGWLVPLALIGMLAVGLVARGRKDRRTGAIFVLGGWFLVELLTLDFSAGIVHPYYSSALAPGLAAMTGAGVVALAWLLRHREARIALRGYCLTVVAIVGTVAAQLVLINREGDPLWWRIPLVVLCTAGIAALALARARAGWGLAVAVGAVLVAPMVFSFSVWLAPVAGTFPSVGPYSYAGRGGVGLSASGLRASRELIHYLRTHGATHPYELLTQSVDQASSFILLGLRTAPEGGYNTTDPALSATRLANLVSQRKARYLLIAGPYANRGGNSAATAARLVCPEIPQIVWSAGSSGGGAGGYLVDCAGKAPELRHPYATARAYRRKYKVHYVL